MDTNSYVVVFSPTLDVHTALFNWDLPDYAISIKGSRSQKCIFRFSEELTVGISSQFILFTAVIIVCKPHLSLSKYRSLSETYTSEIYM